MSFALATKFPELVSLPLVDQPHPAAVSTEAASGRYPNRVANVVQVGPDRVATRKPFRLPLILRATSNTLCPSSRLVSSRPSSCGSGRERNTENCSGFLTNTLANTEFWKYVKSFKCSIDSTQLLIFRSRLDQGRQTAIPLQFEQLENGRKRLVVDVHHRQRRPMAHGQSESFRIGRHVGTGRWRRPPVQRNLHLRGPPVHASR